MGVNNGLIFNTNGGAITTFNVGSLAGSGNVALADGGHVLTLGAGGNEAATTYSGALSGAGGLTKTGSGISTLSGNNTYTGVTSIAAGTLLLDFSQPGAPAANIINNTNNSSSLAMAGGILAIQGNTNTSNSQQFNGLTVSPGCSAIVLSTAGSANPLLLSLGNISRSTTGSTVDFTLPGGSQSAANGVLTTSPNNATGILGAYATVAGTDWASSAGTNGTAGNITPYTSYTGGDLGSLSPNAALNLELSGTQSAVTFAVTINTLNLNFANGVTMNANGSLTLAGGGLIGNTFGGISGGTLEGSAGKGELIVITPQNLTIASVIADNGGPTALTKAGSATLILTGSNSYSGVTTIGAGVLQVGNGGAPGASGTGTVIDNGALVFDTSGVASISGVISGVGSLTQAGPGTLVLSGSNSYMGGTYVVAGTLEVTNPYTLPDGSSLTVGDNGTSAFDSSANAASTAEALLAAAHGAVTVFQHPATVPVPEPGTWSLISAALVLIGGWRRVAFAGDSLLHHSSLSKRLDQ